MGLFVGGILAHGLHEHLIACFVGSRLLAGAGLLQVEAVAAAPFPRVVQVEHGLHAPFAHLLQQIVEACQDGVVVDARCFLQRRLHFRLHASHAVAAHEYAQVVQSQLVQLVEFAAQPLAVASLSLRGQDGPIPEVGSHVAILLAVEREARSFSFHKSVGLLGSFLCAARQQHCCHH